ncbi:hypothetical protein ACH9EU_03455 [Kocuria sp. M1R5S2]|uniref:hypothetical protein n=1 Tax=Kocuria rhizosphaerae TaxID=3376285 RepID=UPI0037BCBCF5
MTQTPWRFPVAQRFSGIKSSPVRDIVALVEQATCRAALPGTSSRTLLLNGVSKIMAPGHRGSA